MRKEIMFVLALLVLTPFVMAQQTQFRAGITPDSPFYGIDIALERIRMALTFGEENKVNYGLKIAEERIGEMEEMVRQQNQNALEIAINERTQIREGIEIDSIGVSEQIKLQIRERLEIHTEEMTRIQNQAENVELKTNIAEEVQNTNSLKTRIRGIE